VLIALLLAGLLAGQKADPTLADAMALMQSGDFSGAAKMLEVGVPSAGVQTVRPISGGRWPTMLTPERCGLRISAEWMAAVAAGPARLSKRHELPVDTLSPIRT
jgi:hypothetical protein